MIFVTGATGNIGHELVRLLEGRRVRALTRDASKAKTRLGAYVEIVEGDLTRPEGFAHALEGVTSAFFVGAAGPKLAETGAAFAEVAASRGVRHVVVVSSGTIAFEPPTTIGRWHLALEESVRKTKLAWTFLRPGNFASNALRWAGSIRAQGAVYGTHAEHESAPIDPRDIAAVAFAALTQPGHEGKTYTLTSSVRFTARAQVEALATALGKPLRFVEVPEESARKGMAASGMPETMVEAIFELTRATTRGGNIVTSDVRDVTGKEPRTFADWARDHAHAFA